jgi:hypothetical protein
MSFIPPGRRINRLREAKEIPGTHFKAGIVPVSDMRNSGEAVSAKGALLAISEFPIQSSGWGQREH